MSTPGTVDISHHLDDEIGQALFLTLITNAVVLRNTTYLGDALDALSPS